MTTIKERLDNLKAEIPESVKLVAISKYKPLEVVMKAYDAGHRIFGENKVQELANKYSQLPQDIEWHMVGHLQTNKVKYIAPFVSLIHSVDSWKLLKEINKQGAKHNRIIKILLQFHIAEEDSKFGLNISEAIQIIENEEFRNLENVEVSGVMGMASFVSEEEQIREEFKNLKAVYTELKKNYFPADSFEVISMGMSGDYNIAIEEGSNCLRIGTSIFGERY